MEKAAAEDPEPTDFGFGDIIMAKAASEENRANVDSGVVQVMEELATTMESATSLSDVAPADDPGAAQCNNQPVGAWTNHWQSTYPPGV